MAVWPYTQAMCLLLLLLQCSGGSSCSRLLLWGRLGGEMGESQDTDGTAAQDQLAAAIAACAGISTARLTVGVAGHGGS